MSNPACIVFRSTRRPDTYVYVLDPATLERLPAALMQSLPPFVEALRFELTPGRRLARVDSEVLRANLTSIGYHLQFPPEHGEPIGDVRNLGRS